MSPVLKSASPRAKSAAVSAAENRGSADDSTGEGFASVEAAIAGAEPPAGAAFAAAMMVEGAGSFGGGGAAMALASGAAGAAGILDVASGFAPVGALAVADGGNVAGEAVANPELVFVVDPDGMPTTPAAGRSGSAGARPATSGGGSAKADGRSDAVGL